MFKGKAKIMGKLFGALLASAVCLAGCNSGSPPPDLVKTQRETMNQAKDVGQAMQAADDARKERVDEAAK